MKVKQHKDDRFLLKIYGFCDLFTHKFIPDSINMFLQDLSLTVWCKNMEIFTADIKDRLVNKNLSRHHLIQLVHMDRVGLKQCLKIGI